MKWLSESLNLLGNGFLSALAGAVAGAFSSYWLQKYLENRKTANQRHGAVMRAQLAVIMHLNFLCSFRLKTLDPVRSESEGTRATRIPMTPVTRSTLGLDCEALAFLLTTEDANLIPNSAIAQQAYHAVIEHIEDRNELLRVIYRESDLVAPPNLATGVCTVSGDARSMMMLISITNAVYEAVDHAIKANRSVFDDLQRIAHKHFPKEGALYLDTQKIGNISAVLGS